MVWVSAVEEVELVVVDSLEVEVESEVESEAESETVGAGDDDDPEAPDRPSASIPPMVIATSAARIDRARRTRLTRTPWRCTKI